MGIKEGEMVPFRFPTDEATVNRVQSDLIIVSYHRLTDQFCYPSVAKQKLGFFDGLIHQK